MKSLHLLLILGLLILSLSVSSCRPPELEGAVVHYNAGRNDQALTLAQEATEKYPDNPEAWFYPPYLVEGPRYLFLYQYKGRQVVNDSPLKRRQ